MSSLLSLCWCRFGSAVAVAKFEKPRPSSSLFINSNQVLLCRGFYHSIWGTTFRWSRLKQDKICLKTHIIIIILRRNMWVWSIRPIIHLTWELICNFLLWATVWTTDNSLIQYRVTDNCKYVIHSSRMTEEVGSDVLLVSEPLFHLCKFIKFM